MKDYLSFVLEVVDRRPKPLVTKPRMQYGGKISHCVPAGGGAGGGVGGGAGGELQTLRAETPNELSASVPTGMPAFKVHKPKFALNVKAVHPATEHSAMHASRSPAFGQAKA